LGVSGADSRVQIYESVEIQAHPESLQPIQDRVQSAIYALALAASVSVWFIAIRAPLWLDETISFWQIHAGFSKISSRQGLSFGAYSYILWLATKIFGTSEIGLRIPEILAMLGAVYLLYRAAWELFDRDVALITVAVFCLHPIIVFASIDVRPYAFAALAINAAIYVLVRLRRSNSKWLAALFGASAASIVYFQFLFVAILPALAICFLLSKKASDAKKMERQFGVAFGAFALAFLPTIPGLLYMFRTSGTHVFEDVPKLADVAWTLAPGELIYVFGAAALAAAVTGQIDLKDRVDGLSVLLCASLTLGPILVLYGVSVGTPIHIFTPRHRLVAIPGIALCWGLLVSRIHSRFIRVVFCAAFVSATAYSYVSSTDSNQHGYTWKYALEFAEKNASADNAPVLICSDLPEADHMPMPVGSAVKDSTLFAPLTYYKLSGPVVPLPRALNEEAVRVGSDFLQDAARRRKRFLALASSPSYRTLDWIADIASGTYNVRELARLDGIVIVEFLPRTKADASR
jgi:hypothetical protein